jgi:hypothetical protein
LIPRCQNLWRPEMWLPRAWLEAPAALYTLAGSCKMH